MSNVKESPAESIDIPETKQAPDAVARPQVSFGRRVADFFFGYDFFISYAHADGIDYPQALAAALEARGYKVFLDEREYAAGEDLRIGTKRMVGKSRYLVLVARDHLVAREEREETNWVRQEVEASLRSKRTPVVIDVNGAFSRASPQNRLHRLLANRIFLAEQVADPRGAPSERLVQKLADGFTVTRQDSVRLRWISSAALGLLALAVVAAWQAWVAEQRRVEAERQRDEALSRLLTIEGRRLREEAPDTALLLAAEAVRIRPATAARDLLRNLLLSEPRMERFLQGGGPRWRLATIAEDASAIASVAIDGDVAVWRVAGDRLHPQMLEKADRELSSLAVSTEGAHVAGGTQDGQRVLIWNGRTGKLEHTLDADHIGAVLGLAFSPDGSSLVSGGTFTATFLWSVVTGERLRQLDQHKSGVRAIAFAPDGKSLATAAEGGRVVIWRLDAPRQSWQVLTDGAPPYVFALAFSPDGRWLAAGGQGDHVALWQLEHEQPEATRFSGRHSGEVVQLRFAPEGGTMAVRTRNGPVSFYDSSDGRAESHAPLDSGPTSHRNFAWVEGGKALLTLGPGNFARRWAVEAQLGRMVRVLGGHGQGTRDIGFGAGNVLFSTGCPAPDTEATVFGWNVGCAFGREIQRWEVGSVSGEPTAAWPSDGMVSRLAARRDGHSVLLVLAGGHLAVWDTAENQIVARHPRPGPPPPAPAEKTNATPEPSVSVATSLLRVSGTWRKRNAGFRRVGGNMPPPPCAIHNTSPDAIAVSPGGEVVHYGGGPDGCVFRWREGDGWRPLPLFENESTISAIAVSPDGTRVAVGGKHGSVTLWHLAPKVERAWREELGKDRTITALDFSPNGDLLLIGVGKFEPDPVESFFQSGRDVGYAMLWSAARNQLVSPITTTPPSLLGGSIGAVAFSPDGSLAAVGGCRKAGRMFNAGCDVGELVLWDVRSASQIGPPVAAHSGAVERIAWRGDGEMLATASESSVPTNPRILLWDLRPERLIEMACDVAGRPLATEEIQSYLSGRPAMACAGGDRTHDK